MKLKPSNSCLISLFVIKKGAIRRLFVLLSLHFLLFLPFAGTADQRLAELHQEGHGNGRRC
ncbi:MAG: hypothetical protein ACRDDN_06580, partial [Aeromonas veronii]